MLLAFGKFFPALENAPNGKYFFKRRDLFLKIYAKIKIMTIKPPQISGIATKILSAYVYWHRLTRHIPKMTRYSLGIKIDSLFSDLIALVAEAQFAQKNKRHEILMEAIKVNDVLKFMLYTLLELQGLEEIHFIELAGNMEEVGRMLYGWKNQALR